MQRKWFFAGNHCVWYTVSKFPDSCLFNRAKRVMDGRGLTGCRSVAEAAWQSSDTALPIGQVFWQLAGWSLAGRFMCALGSARVWGTACSPHILARAVGIDGCRLTGREVGKCRFINRKRLYLYNLYGDFWILVLFQIPHSNSLRLGVGDFAAGAFADVSTDIDHEDLVGHVDLTFVRLPISWIQIGTCDCRFEKYWISGRFVPKCHDTRCGPCSYARETLQLPSSSRRTQKAVENEQEKNILTMNDCSNLSVKWRTYQDDGNCRCLEWNHLGYAEGYMSSM